MKFNVKIKPHVFVYSSVDNECQQVGGRGLWVLEAAEAPPHQQNFTTQRGCRGNSQHQPGLFIGPVCIHLLYRAKGQGLLLDIIMYLNIGIIVLISASVCSEGGGGV